jgi:hypothetical protein
MIPALIASLIVLVLEIVVTLSLIEHVAVKDVQHLKFDITFFCIGLASLVVIFHVLITNRRQIFAR